jgi:diguanylate cyclase (GGDEF)-like protein
MAVQLHDRETDLRRTNELLLDLASKDGLTGIANRRAFDERIAAEWNRAGRDSRPLSLLTIDVDYFKKFNDRYGHLVGDACLREVAKTLSLSARRGGDLVARIGGEEFAVLLPNLDLEGAGRIAEALRERIEQLGVEHCESPLRIVTVSVGVAAARPVKGASFNALIDWADSALYEAKRAGRNRVVLDRPKISLAS